MDNKKKGKLIGIIMQNLKFEASQATLGPKAFDEAGTFFKLAFMTDEQLLKIGFQLGIGE